MTESKPSSQPDDTPAPQPADEAAAAPEQPPEQSQAEQPEQPKTGPEEPAAEPKEEQPESQPESPSGSQPVGSPWVRRRTGLLRPPRLPDESMEPLPQSMTIGAALQAPFLHFLLQIPLKKVLIWAAFGGLLWVLRDFFGLIFLTFVISYIATGIVDRVESRFSSRKIPILLVFGAIVVALGGVGYLAGTKAVQQGERQLAKLESLDDPGKLLRVNAVRALGQQPEAKQGAGQVGGAFGAVFGHAERRGEAGGLAATAASYLEDPAIQAQLAETLKHFNEDVLVPQLTHAVGTIWKGVLFLFLALIFSFMIVWDAPKLSDGISKLAESRVGEVWEEVAPSIATFAELLGKAFEAQTLIAFVNTLLTAVGMWMLGIPGIGFLSLIVFVCSFIPVVGVFISTVPICVMSLQADHGGVMLLLGVVVMVTVAHMVEAYVLNPRIYGFHMKLHPLAVLIVLYLGQHLIGVWGLILGVPLATYAWRYLIMGEGMPSHGGKAGAPAPVS